MLTSEFERYANAGDPEALTGAFYAQDALLLPPNTLPAKGRAAIGEFWTAFLATSASDARLENLDVSVSGDLAYSTGTYEYTHAGVRHRGKDLVVYRRQSDVSFRQACMTPPARS